MTVLIVSSFEDGHAHAVLSELARRGVAAEVLDLREFPENLALCLSFSSSMRRLELKRRGGGALDLDAVRAVWWRRPGGFVFPEAVRDPAHRRLAFSEGATALSGALAAMNALWVNPPALDAVAAHKPYQLAVARDVGLDVPETLMTNDPDEARAFWRRFENQVVYKQFIALADSWAETRRLGEAEQKATDESLRLAPVIFQKFVPADFELRVTIIGDEVFAAAVDIRKLGYAVDIRMNLDARHVAYDLPETIAERLRALMRRLGLVYGAVDLRLDAEGRYNFLEINPAGQFLYVEQQSGQPIAAALAAKLASADCAT